MALDSPRKLRLHARVDSIAVQAAEFVEITLGQIDLPCQSLSQQTLGTKVAHAHGFLRDPECLCRFRYAQFFHRTQHEHDTQRLRQSADLALEDAPHLRSRGSVVRTLGDVSHTLGLGRARLRADEWDDVPAPRRTPLAGATLVQNQP